MTTLSDEEVFGSAGGKTLTDAEVFGEVAAPTKPALPSNSPRRFYSPEPQERFPLAKGAIGVAAQTGDMLLGAPARLLGKARNVTRRGIAMAEGETQEQQGVSGALAEDLGWAESAKSPLQTLARLTMGAEGPAPGVVGEAMEGLNKGISKLSGGLLTKEDAAMLTETAMDLLMAKTVKPLAVAMKPATPRGRENQRTPGIVEGEVLPRADAAVDASKARIAAGERAPIEGEARVVEEPQQLTKQVGKADPELLAWLGAGTAAGLWLAQSEDMSEDAVAMAVAAGAVKAKGGMWHPEAVKRLGTPLYDKLSKDTAHADLVVPRDAPERAAVDNAARIVTEWPYKATRNYLNKYAGTEGDPIAAVPIPFGEGTKPWGELMGAMVASRPNRAGRFSAEWEQKIPEGEAIWDLGGTRKANDPQLMSRETSRASAAVSSYLSHVGDYLREHVTPEKLQQYDLTRAVLETAKWDKELAKKMSDARLADMADSPVYKDYGDGMRWVQLTKPGQFARESDTMGHSVRGYEPPAALNRPRYSPEGPTTDAEAAHPDWLPASGDSGHPSYGLGGWEAIKRGDAKIYSLRDAKGESHVTVEVGGPDIREQGRTPVDFYKQAPKEVQERIGFEPTEHINHESAGDWTRRHRAWRQEIIRDPAFKEWFDAQPHSITQIKGKQNRAPAAAYLPYVQDFVRSGKWGEVGDLGNTGLTRGSDVFKWDDFKKYAEQANIKFEPDKYYTKEEIEATMKGPSSQRGSASLDLVAKLGLTLSAAAVGAAVSDDPLLGASLAGVGALALLSKGGRSVLNDGLKAADVALGMVSTRLLHESPPVLRAQMTFERRNMTRLGDYLKRSDPFLIAVEKLPKELRSRVEQALTTNDAEAVYRLLGHDSPAAKSFGELRGVLHEVGSELLKNNRILKLAKEYFPRLVIDLEGLKKTLNADAKLGLEKLLSDATLEAVKAGRPGLTRSEESTIVNDYLQRKGAQSFQPGFAKNRGVKEVTAELAPFYARPAEALHHYLRDAVLDLEAARYFGKNLRTLKKDGLTYIDYRNSIGEVIADALRKGELKPEGAEEVIKLLRSRFNGGEQLAPKLFQDAANYAYGGLLGNWIAPITQFSDLGTVAAAQGLTPTLVAVVNQLRGKQGLRPEDMGMINHSIEEFITNTRSAKYAQWALNRGFPFTKGWKDSRMKDLGSFTYADMAMKGTMIEAARLRMQKQAASPKGQAELARTYGEYFGEDFPALVKELKAGEKTENVLDALFYEISRTQPVTRLERSQWALDHPGGRIIFTLKNWALKQADFVRREAYDEFKRGNRAKAVGFLLRYGTLLGVSGATTAAITNWMLGKDADISAGDILENVAKTFALNSYTRDKVASGRPVEAAVNTATPPYKIFQDILTLDKKAIRYLPGIGPILYNWSFGGKEEAALQKQTKEKKKAADEKLSPEQRQAREEKRKAAREKRAREAYNKQLSGENLSDLTFTDTPNGQVVESFIEKPKYVRGREDFARQRMLDDEDFKGRIASEGERKELIARAQKLFGRKGVRDASRMLMEESAWRGDARKRKPGRIAS